MSDLGPQIVAAARGWIGTPYRHQASCKGAGTDCLGLLRGIWRDVLGAEPEVIPAYTMDWSEPGREEVLWCAAARHLTGLWVSSRSRWRRFQQALVLGPLRLSTSVFDAKGL